MIPEIRKKFNSAWSEEKYKAVLHDLNTEFDFYIDFRIAETPIFIPMDLKLKILDAVDVITSYLWTDEYKKISLNAIPAGLEVPNDPGYPAMLALDFAVCKDMDGNFIPQLIELQGFSSLFFYELLQNKMYRRHFEIPSNFGGLFNIQEPVGYIEVLRDTVVGNLNPENVILLEIDPDNQKTRIDFACCEKFIGVRPVCLTDVLKEGKDLFYIRDGKKTKIERIYNRVIFDELDRRSDLKFNFSFHDELNVEWLPHPNWFYRISKYSLPYLSRRDGYPKNKYVPETKFLSDFETIPADLESYVLKPLFSFAGVGVKYDVTKDIIDSIPHSDRHNYILQRKINYEPIIETPDTPAKAEIRLLFVHKDKKPYLINNLVRLSKGKMMGVDFNKDKTWVGSSLAYFEY